jgi:signal peptidase I
MKRLDDSPHGKEDALKCELAAEILRSFGALRLQVTGHSMLPAIWPGDVLLVQRCDFGEISPGEIVLYARESHLVAHRVIRAGARLEDPFLVTQGDALPAQDSPISPAEFLGRVSQIIHAGERRAPASTLTFKNRFIATAVRHSTFASRLLVHQHVTRNTGGRNTLC